MTDYVIVTLLESNSFFGELIQWRLESNWVHGIIQIDEDIYSTTFPVTIKTNSSNPEVGMPPRTGSSWKVPVTSDQKAKIRSYCESRIGVPYDYLSALGWALRIRALQTKNLTYCFESVYDALSAGGLVPNRGKKFISGDQLEVITLQLGGVQSHNNAVGIKGLLKTAMKLKLK